MELPTVLPGLDTTLGFTTVEAGPDRVVVTWSVDARHLQPQGLVHGGVYCSVVEGSASMGASLWLGDRGSVVGVANHTNFLRAAGAGTMTAVATPLHRGRSQQLWLVVISDPDERVVARGEVRLQNLSTPDPST